jgi:hypothetical protein
MRLCTDPADDAPGPGDSAIMGSLVPMSPLAGEKEVRCTSAG